MSMEEELELSGLFWTKALPEAAHLAMVQDMSPVKLDEICRGLGIVLPALYLEMACSVQGRCPSRTAFVVWDISESLGGALPELGSGQVRDIASFAVLGLQPSSPWLGDAIGTQLDLLTPSNPGLFPFAFDLRGNLLCLDYGEEWTDEIPSVVYCDRARSDGDDVFPVSPNFAGLLATLSESVDEIAISTPSER